MASKFIFSISLEEMQETAIDKAALLKQDLGVLKDRGVDQARLDAFDTKQNDLTNIPTDDVQTQITAKVYQKRNIEANAHRGRIRDIQGIAKNSFGKTANLSMKTREYKSFKFNNLSQKSAADLHTLTPNVIAQSNANFTVMEIKGLTKNALIDLNNSNVDLLARIDDTVVADGDEIAMTGKRHTVANDVFTELVSMCGIAYSYFETRDPDRAKQYVIYDKKPNYLVREGKIASNKFATPKAEKLMPDTAFQIILFLGQTIQVYFGKTKKEKPGASPVTISYNPNNYSKYTAAQLGYNEATGNIVFNIYNPDADEAWFKVKISN